MKKILLVLLVLLLTISTVGCTKNTKYANGNVKYKGEWKSGMANGNGIEYYEDGKVKYNGSYKDGLYDGKGKLLNIDGIIIEGEFKSGEADGMGIMYDINSKKIYEGEFNSGEVTGMGIIYKSTGKKLFEGALKNGNAVMGKMYNDKGYCYHNGRVIDGYPDYTGSKGTIPDRKGTIGITKFDVDTIEGNIQFWVSSYRIDSEEDNLFIGALTDYTEDTLTYEIKYWPKMYDDAKWGEFARGYTTMTICQDILTFESMSGDDFDGTGNITPYSPVCILNKQ